MIRMVEIPAPTAASVNATSGACMVVKRPAEMRLNRPNTMATANRSRSLRIAIAQMAMKASSRMSTSVAISRAFHPA
jgi:hypothetical protein